MNEYLKVKTNIKQNYKMTEKIIKHKIIKYIDYMK